MIRRPPEYTRTYTLCPYPSLCRSEMRAVNEQFLGHAAANDAGAPDPILFCYGNARAVRGGDARGADPARTGADDEEIIVEIAHGLPLKWTGGHSRPDRKSTRLNSSH